MDDAKTRRPIGPSAAEDRAQLVEILARIGEEDRSALRDAYRLTSAKLFGICLRICGERSGAEDVLQEVYVTIWKRAGAFEPGRASPISWLATIARNRSIDWVRARGKRPTRPIEEAGAIADDSPDQLAMAESDETVRRLHDCLDALDARQRDAIRTAFFDGMTYSELASAKAVPLGTMKSWVRRGLRQLRECVGDD
ncbi:MAG: sigma-70 family RNA polymerase sigma factor [Sphingomonas sp.]|uniref:sigma-70 family RNA polymerase sigma factor n=1 Tax=Sphingomonas sp. TaxID=28214 RepID=UPI001AD116B2|nr:sigma-70 family RNA polymerase sigma factor [Sphingomonas sp.]MBN8806764.1 sigma-70 family RNA polymerase sigma factor [Sphingomonas sp.]